MTSLYVPMTRINERSSPVPGTEFDNVYVDQNLVIMALSAKQATQTSRPRATDVRAFLRREIEASYDLISQIYGGNDPDSPQIVAAYEHAVDQLATHLRNREYWKSFDDYRDLARVMPGIFRYEESSPGKDKNRSLVILRVIMCYSIAVEAGLLDSQLRVDMKRVLGKDGGDDPEVDAMRFYSPKPDPAAEEKFRQYVTKRWPLITFAVDPVVDQQNIADASSVKRDLQLALAFAFSTGQINFNQLTQFQRRIEVDAETIALNRTVTSFAHGNDTFGFRFSPRFQNPPMEKSNLHVIANQLIRGGPGRNYALNNAKLEAGQRELSAVVIMPSFLQGIQMDVTGNWFPLHDPDQMMIGTPRMIEQGRKVVALRDALGCIRDTKRYRTGDLQRLKTRVDQLEAMLPMQTREIRVPYENTLGGFQLFQQGVTSLVPQLDGFQGADSIVKGGKGTDLLLFGKHFSIQETNVVVGGVYLSLNSLSTLGSNQIPIQSTTTPSTQGFSPSGSPFLTQAATTPNSTTPTITPTTSNNLAIDIISREVIRVSIPTGVNKTDIYDADSKTTKSYVEIFVATPTGISNRLLVPYLDTDAPAPPVVAYAIDAKSANFPVNYTFERDAIGGIRPVRGTPGAGANLVINWSSPLGAAPRSIGLSITFKYKGATIKIPLATPIVRGSGGKYKLGVDDLGRIAADFIGEIAKIDPSVNLATPLAPITVDSVDITPDDPNIDVQTVKATGSLKFTPQLANDGLGLVQPIDPAARRASFTPTSTPTARRPATLDLPPLPAPARPASRPTREPARPRGVAPRTR